MDILKDINNNEYTGNNPNIIKEHLFNNNSKFNNNSYFI